MATAGRFRRPIYFGGSLYNGMWQAIDQGNTGYICEDVQSAVGVLQCLDELSRPEIRAQFERRFSARTMAQRYVDSYASQAARHPLLRRAAG